MQTASSALWKERCARWTVSIHLSFACVQTFTSQLNSQPTMRICMYSVCIRICMCVVLWCIFRRAERAGISIYTSIMKIKKNTVCEPHRICRCCVFVFFVSIHVSVPRLLFVSLMIVLCVCMCVRERCSGSCTHNTVFHPLTRAYFSGSLLNLCALYTLTRGALLYSLVVYELCTNRIKTRNSRPKHCVVRCVFRVFILSPAQFFPERCLYVDYHVGSPPFVLLYRFGGAAFTNEIYKQADIEHAAWCVCVCVCTHLVVICCLDERCLWICITSQHNYDQSSGSVCVQTFDNNQIDTSHWTWRWRCFPYYFHLIVLLTHRADEPLCGSVFNQIRMSEYGKSRAREITNRFDSCALRSIRFRSYRQTNMRPGKCVNTHISIRYSVSDCDPFASFSLANVWHGWESDSGSVGHIEDRHIDLHVLLVLAMPLPHRSRTTHTWRWRVESICVTHLTQARSFMHCAHCDDGVQIYSEIRSVGRRSCRSCNAALCVAAAKICNRKPDCCASVRVRVVVMCIWRGCFCHHTFSVG